MKLARILLRVAVAAALGLSLSPARAETFVLVHGAFQSAAAWAAVAQELKAAGHNPVVVDLPGRNAEGSAAKQVTLDAHRDAALAAIRAENGPVVLVGHSFGGIVISAVAEAAPDRVRRLVYVAAYLPLSGESLQKLAEGDRGTKFSKENFVVAPDYSSATVLPRDRGLIFANDATEEQRRKIADELLREPLAPLGTPVTLTPERFGRVEKAFIRTLRDNAVSLELQDAMVARTPVGKVLTLDAGHAPSLTRPGELTKLLIEAAR